MPSVMYKGFKIVTRPYRLRESGRWTVDFQIRRDGRVRAFTQDERYSTEQEAGAACLALGRRIIDGHEPGISVDDLRGDHSDRSPRVILPARWAQGGRRAAAARSGRVSEVRVVAAGGGDSTRRS
jgi:hypothetical protein